VAPQRCFCVERRYNFPDLWSILQLWRPNRAPSRFSRLLFAALACSVFVWGLQYKLSLYDAPQAAPHSVIAAKLLSKNEQTNLTEASPYTKSDQPVKALLTLSGVVSFILVAVCGTLLPAYRRRYVAANPPRLLQQTLREAYFVRPPPSALSL
jgi:hypothetical protein